MYVILEVVSTATGAIVGRTTGYFVGLNDEIVVGFMLGAVDVGSADRLSVGFTEGVFDGGLLGASDGPIVGEQLG